MNKKKLHAIEQVLTVNKDIVELCEKRGVSCNDLKAVFRLAARALDTPVTEDRPPWTRPSIYGKLEDALEDEYYRDIAAFYYDEEEEGW